MYNAETLDKYKEACGNDMLFFDFVLEQITLSYMSTEYNSYALLSTQHPLEVADAIGYLHLQGKRKWKQDTLYWIREKLRTFNMPLYNEAYKSSKKNIMST